VLSGTLDRLLSHRGITNVGTINWANGGRLFSGNSTISNTGTFNFAADTQIIDNGGGVSSLVNQTGGVIQKTAGSGVSGIGIPLNNSGSVVANSGAFTFGSVSNSGQLTPSAAPGQAPTVVTVSQTYTQSAGASLTLDISGSTCTNFDQLSVSGNATLDGTLTVTAVAPCATPAQARYVILKAASISGAFKTVTLPAGYLLQQTATEIDLVHQ
jgi:hypothetical protein